MDDLLNWPTVSRIARTRVQLLKRDEESCGRITDITVTADASWASPSSVFSPSVSPYCGETSSLFDGTIPAETFRHKGQTHEPISRGSPECRRFVICGTPRAAGRSLTLGTGI